MTQTTASFSQTSYTNIGKTTALSMSPQTLQKIIFWGNHYQKGMDGNSSFAKNGVEIDHRNKDDSVSIDAHIMRNGAPETIKLNFQRQAGQDDLIFHSGTYSRGNALEMIETSRRFIDIALCLYKNTRAAQDPKWGLDLDMRAEARAAAAQMLDTGMLPILTVNQNGQTEFTPPKVGRQKACLNPCGKCRLT